MLNLLARTISLYSPLLIMLYYSRSISFSLLHITYSLNLTVKLILLGSLTSSTAYYLKTSIILKVSYLTLISKQLILITC